MDRLYPGKWLLIIVCLILAACNNQGKVADGDNADSIAVADTHASPVHADTAIAGCYSQIMKKDTATLQLQVKGDNITGTLSYQYFQKDHNDGTFKADLDNDILYGWYLFRSEGIVSVRQVAWKVHGDQLWPAIGEMIERNDTSYYKNMDQLRYDSVRPFMRVPCTI